MIIYFKHDAVSASLVFTFGGQAQLEKNADSVKNTKVFLTTIVELNTNADLNFVTLNTSSKFSSFDSYVYIIGAFELFKH